MKKINLVLICILQIMFFSCVKDDGKQKDISTLNDPEIIEMKNLTSEYYNPYSKMLQKEEYFVIINPPVDAFELTKLIADFNESTLTKEDILKYPGAFMRMFYRKSKETIDVYNEPSLNYANKKLERNCYKDRLFYVMWRRSLNGGIDVDYSCMFNGYEWTAYNALDNELFHPWRKDDIIRQWNPEKKRLEIIGKTPKTLD